MLLNGGRGLLRANRKETARANQEDNHKTGKGHQDKLHETRYPSSNQTLAGRVARSRSERSKRPAPMQRLN